MAVPKRKQSKSRTRRRRSTHDKVATPNVAWCKNCGERKASHKVCMSCGQYNGRQVIQVVIQ